MSQPIRISTQPARRIAFLDLWRGLAVVVMIFYHGAYDLASIFGVSFSFFGNPVYHVIQRFICCSFILLSGISCRFSKNNLKRGVITFCCGLLMTIVTWLVMPSELILFGILHFLGIAMTLAGLMMPLLQKIPPLAGFIGTLLLAALTWNVSRGTLGMGVLSVPLPEVLYRSNLLFPLGFYSPSFFSADYFPLLPWFFLFLAGYFLGRPFQSPFLPGFFRKNWAPPLAFLGRHSLLIYLLHQPVLFGVLWLWFRLFS